jgi:hypothetical protein
MTQRDPQASIALAEATKTDAQNTRAIAEITLRDSASLKTIAILTMIFLPGTFLCVSLLFTFMLTSHRTSKHQGEDLH